MRLAIVTFAMTHLVLNSSTDTMAHRPWLGETCDTVMPDGSPAKVVLLHYDGLFGPDPVEPLVMDENGVVVAVASSVGRNYLLI